VRRAGRDRGRVRTASRALSEPWGPARISSDRRALSALRRRTCSPSRESSRLCAASCADVSDRRAARRAFSSSAPARAASAPAARRSSCPTRTSRRVTSERSRWRSTCAAPSPARHARERHGRPCKAREARGGRTQRPREPVLDVGDEVARLRAARACLERGSDVAERPRVLLFSTPHEVTQALDFLVALQDLARQAILPARPGLPHHGRGVEKVPLGGGFRKALLHPPVRPKRDSPDPARRIALYHAGEAHLAGGAPASAPHAAPAMPSCTCRQHLPELTHLRVSNRSSRHRRYALE
jgi:hypothetical protein